jgi:hypothetical protein
MLLSNKENSPEYHQLFADLLSEIHLLTNKWLIKANLTEVSEHLITNNFQIDSHRCCKNLLRIFICFIT